MFLNHSRLANVYKAAQRKLDNVSKFNFHRYILSSGTYFPLMVLMDGQKRPTHVSNTRKAINISSWFYNIQHTSQTRGRL